jgi:hypothetical protein
MSTKDLRSAIWRFGARTGLAISTNWAALEKAGTM